MECNTSSISPIVCFVNFPKGKHDISKRKKKVPKKLVIEYSKHDDEWEKLSMGIDLGLEMA